MAKTIYESIFSKLTRIFGDLSNLPDSMKLEATGFMDLRMNVLERESDVITISLSHYYEQNGDLVPDPDMELRIFPDLQMAEALTYQDTYTYQVIYPTPEVTNVALKTQLNKFLSQWLSNIIQQGHKPV